MNAPNSYEVKSRKQRTMNYQAEYKRLQEHQTIKNYGGVEKAKRKRRFPSQLSAEEP